VLAPRGERPHETAGQQHVTHPRTGRIGPATPRRWKEVGQVTELHVALEVNGERREVDVEPRRLLVQLLREDLNLTGTHVGCDTSQCGACTVHVDGKAVKSCTMLAAQADGTTVTTIEGLSNGVDLHPLQQGFWEKHGLQCGFCTPGMIMAAHQILERYPKPTEDQIRHQLEGNLCRCTGYHNIVKAIQWASEQMAGKK
jgi:aerobic carbon-monoxide dehydrogenase small subunit